jgi:hypothetical protein
MGKLENNLERVLAVSTANITPQDGRLIAMREAPFRMMEHDEKYGTMFYAVPFGPAFPGEVNLSVDQLHAFGFSTAFVQIMQDAGAENFDRVYFEGDAPMLPEEYPTFEWDTNVRIPEDTNVVHLHYRERVERNLSPKAIENLERFLFKGEIRVSNLTLHLKAILEREWAAQILEDFRDKVMCPEDARPDTDSEYTRQYYDRALGQLKVDLPQDHRDGVAVFFTETCTERPRLIRELEIEAIRCAYADLVGAKQARDQQDIGIHDWKAHEFTITELENAFPFIDPVTDNDDS